MVIGTFDKQARYSFLITYIILFILKFTLIYIVFTIFAIIFEILLFSRLLRVCLLHVCCHYLFSYLN